MIKIVYSIAGYSTRKHLILDSDTRASSETQAQSVGSEKKTGQKFSSKGGSASGYRLSPNYFQKFKRIPAPDWAQKTFCIIVPNRRTVSSEFFSWVRTRRLLSRHTCPVRSPGLCVQGKLLFSTFLTRNRGTTWGKFNCGNWICPENILFLTDHNQERKSNK